MKPARVDDEMRYWGEKPPELSARCQWWESRFRSGFRPNRRIRSMGYHEAAEWYGVYLWEYLNRIRPIENELSQNPQGTK